MGKALFFLILILNLNIACFSQILKISSNEAIEIAMNNNLELQSKRKEIEMKKLDIKIADEFLNPQFQSNFLLGGITKGNPNQFGGYLPVEILKRGVRKKSEIAKLKILQEELSALEYNLKINTLKAYFEVLYHKSVLDSMLEREKLFLEFNSLDKKMNEMDNLDFNIRYKKHLVILNNARANVLSSQYNFNSVLNLKDDLILYDTLEDGFLSRGASILKKHIPQYSAIESKALIYSNSIKIAKASIDEAKSNLKIQQHKIIPDLGIASGVAYQTRNQALSGAYIGIYADIPILNRFKPDIKKAKITIEKSKIDKESYESRLKLTLKDNYAEFKLNKENLELYDEILENSKEKFEYYKQKYKHGEISAVDLIQIEDEYQNTKSDYLDIINTFLISYLILSANAGFDVLSINDEGEKI